MAVAQRHGHVPTWLGVPRRRLKAAPLATATGRSVAAAHAPRALPALVTLTLRRREGRGERARRMWPRLREAPTRGAARPVNLAVAVLILAAVAVLAPASPAGAETPIVCTGTMGPAEPWYDGAETYVTPYGNVVVPAGATCVLVNVQLYGNLIVQDGASVGLCIWAGRSLILNHIYGNVTDGRDASFGASYARIDGNLSAVDADLVSTWMVFFDGSAAVADTKFVQLFESGVNNATFTGNARLQLVSLGFGRNLSCERNGIEIIDLSASGHRSGQCATNYWLPPP